MQFVASGESVELQQEQHQVSVEAAVTVVELHLPVSAVVAIVLHVQLGESLSKENNNILNFKQY